jgi:hypothetical protein
MLPARFQKGRERAKTALYFVDKSVSVIGGPAPAPNRRFDFRSSLHLPVIPDDRLREVKTDLTGLHGKV